jgi:rhodanese-related sulfurtransferase
MRKQKIPFPFLVAGGLLLILAAACSFTQNFANQPTPVFLTQAIASSSTPLLPTQTSASSPTPLPAVSGRLDTSTYPEIPRVSLEKAKAAFDTKSAVFVDVRGSSAYAISHIPGALDIPLEDIETRLNELDPNQWIIPYCTWLNEYTSARAARILLDHSFKNVTPILGGFVAWENASYPLEP